MHRTFHILATAVLFGVLSVGQGTDPSAYPSGAPAAAPYPNEPASAYPNPDVPDPTDQQHGVARVGFLSGNVNVQHGSAAEVVAAVINAPLVTQDRLQTGPASSAEVQLDGGTVARLAENTDLGLADLQFGQARLQLGAGTVLFRQLRPGSTTAELETPAIAIHPLESADLRISVLPDGSTQVTLRGGTADIYGPNGSQRLEAGQSVLVRAGAAGPEFQNTSPPARDSLDDWSAGRDQELLSAASVQYAGADMAGVADLDRNGSWVDSQYGNVWEPQGVSAGWAPYSDGQWVNEPYYGWTWVDAQPWGWAPFHYGRWFVNGNRGWCWWPGLRGARHAWGPAYVGFFGYSGNRGLGWVALAPHEGIQSWWGRGGSRGGYGYGAGGGFRNAAFSGGAVGITAASFGGWRGRFTPLGRQTLVGASAIRGPLPVGSAGYRFGFSNRPAYANPRLASAAGRTFFQAPRSAGFGSFQAPRNGNFGSPRQAAGGYRVYRPSSPANRAYGSQAPGAYRSGAPSGSYSGGSYNRPPSSAGWQRFGDPNSGRAPQSFGNNSRQNYSGGRGESGWHQFGQPDRARPQAQPSFRSQPRQSYGGGSGAQQMRAAPSRGEGGNHGGGGSRGGSGNGSGNGSGGHRR